jgi:hypothetical protein
MGTSNRETDSETNAPTTASESVVNGSENISSATASEFVPTSTSTTLSDSVVTTEQGKMRGKVPHQHYLSKSTSQSPVGPMTKKAFEEGEISSGPMWVEAATQANISRSLKRAAQKQCKGDASRSLLAKTRQQALAGGGFLSASASIDGLSVFTDRSRKSRGHYPSSVVGTLDQINELYHLQEPPFMSGLNISYFGDDILNLATVKTRVAPLMIGGAVAIFGGLVASIYVHCSCDFVTALVEEEALGGGSKDYPFHFGIWKYTPISSVYKGYAYCDRYDEDYKAPIAPRIFGTFALILGTYGLFVLWLYLLKGKTSELAWRTAIYALYIAAFFSFLLSLTLPLKFCKSNTCSLGPSSIVSILTIFAWLMLAYVMKNYAPASVRISAAVRAQSRMSSQRHNGGNEYPQQSSALKLLRKKNGYQADDSSGIQQKTRYTPPDLV